jgi:hypothetical protein
VYIPRLNAESDKPVLHAFIEVEMEIIRLEGKCLPFLRARRHAATTPFRREEQFLEFVQFPNSSQIGCSAAGVQKAPAELQQRNANRSN